MLKKLRKDRNNAVDWQEVLVFISIYEILIQWICLVYGFLFLAFLSMQLFIKIESLFAYLCFFNSIFKGNISWKNNGIFMVLLLLVIKINLRILNIS